MSGAAIPNRVGVADGRTDQHGCAARDHGGGGRPLSIGRAGGEGAHSRRALRGDGLASQACGAGAWRAKVGISPEAPASSAGRTYGATIKDALAALWEASDRICGKRLKVMIPTLLPALEQAWPAASLDQADRELVLGVSAATIDRLLVETKIAASRRQAPTGRLLFGGPA